MVVPALTYTGKASRTTHKVFMPESQNRADRDSTFPPD